MGFIELFFSNFDAYSWWIVGVILIVAEIFVASSFLLWLGLSSILVGCLLFVNVPLNWQLQLFIFAICSIASIIAWRYFSPKKSTNNRMSRRAEKYIGKQFSVAEDFKNGVGKIKIEDTLWRGLSDANPKKGTSVRIISLQGTSFEVEPL